MESNNLFTRNVIAKSHKVLLTSMYLCLHLIIEKFEIIKMQALKVLKKQFQILIGLKHLGIRMQMKAENYWQIKTKAFDNKIPEWMKTLIISALKTAQYLWKSTIEIPLNIIRRHYQIKQMNVQNLYCRSKTKPCR